MKYPCDFLLENKSSPSESSPNKESLLPPPVTKSNAFPDGLVDGADEGVDNVSAFSEES